MIIFAHLKIKTIKSLICFNPMMKKILVSTLLFSFAITSLISQSGSVKGMVTDETTKEVIPFATVALIKNGEENALTGTVSDKDGQFYIENIPYGSYNVLVSFIGFKSKELTDIKVSSAKKEIVIGNIALTPKIIEIKEAEVSTTVNTTVGKIDRRTYRPGDFETARGGTAIDILSKIPAVTIGGDDDITVRGATDFVVYLNGKPANASASVLLGQIPAENIQSIDIITVPTSRYDAQGMGGIINITTTRIVNKGLTVIATGMIGGTPWKNDKDVFSNHSLNNNRLNGGVNLHYNRKKLSLHGSVNYSSKNNKGIGDIYTYIYQNENQPYAGSYYILDGTGARPKWDKNLFTSAGLDYQINDNAAISVNYQYSDRNTGRAAHYKYNTFFTNSTSGQPINGTLYELYNPNDIYRKGHFQSVTMDYNLNMEKNGSLNASFLYENSNLEQTIHNKEFAYDGNRLYYNYYSDDHRNPVFHSFQKDETPLNAYRIAVDYKKELKNGNSLNMGISSQLVRLEGSYEYDTVNTNTDNFEGYNYFDNAINLDRDVYAAYSEYTGIFNKLSYILGVRIEYLDQQMSVRNTGYFEEVYDVFGEIGRDFNEKDFSQQKFDVFPTLHLKYQASEADIITLSASHRINRPPAKDMAPFLYRRHQEIFEMGDPLLEPEYSWNSDLTYNRLLGKHSIILTGFMRSTTNAIYRVNRLDYELANTGGVLLRSYTNAGSQLATGGELGLNLVLHRTVRLFMGGSLYQFSVESNEGLFGDQSKSSSLNWDAKSNLNWSIMAPLKLTLDYSFKSRTVTPQGENIEFQVMNVALNFTPEKLEGWSFFAKMLDVLQTNQSGGYTGATANGMEVFQRDWIYDYEGQILEIGASFNFNQSKEKTKQQMIGNEYF